jgi:hypothetical protein
VRLWIDFVKQTYGDATYWGPITNAAPGAAARQPLAA